MNKRKRLSISYQTLSKLKDALDKAQLHRCGVEQKHQDAMKPYLDTWVVWPLRSAIEAIEGKKS